MTQKEVAEKAGTHANTIARLERGEQEPAWPLVIAIAGALGVDCTAFTEVQAPAPQKKHRGGKK